MHIPCQARVSYNSLILKNKMLHAIFGNSRKTRNWVKYPPNTAEKPAVSRFTLSARIISELQAAKH
jgi:hypothetical protein